MIKPSKTLWNGWDCDHIDTVVGHMDWAHKQGILMVCNPTGLVYIPKGGWVEQDEHGLVVGKTDPKEVPGAVLRSATKLWERFVAGN